MRLLISLLSLTASVSLLAAEMPQNLLRYSSGALPMVQNENNQWVTMNPDSIDWNASYSAVLAGDIGKTVNLTEAKTLLVDLGAPEAINRFSMFASQAEGTLTVYGSPIYEDPTSTNWIELGTTNFNAGTPATLTFNAEARYIMLAFSQASEGTVDSMGLFGEVTLSQLQTPNNMQSPDPLEMSFSMNYGTPATSFNIVNVSPASETDAVWALFDDDPATQYNVMAQTTIIADLGTPRQLNSTVLNTASNADNVTIELAEDLNDLYNNQATLEGFAPFKAMGATPQKAQFAKITMTPQSGPFSIGGISFVGPVLPDAFVFTRDLGAAPAATAPQQRGGNDDPIDNPQQTTDEPAATTAPFIIDRVIRAEV